MEFIIDNNTLKEAINRLSALVDKKSAIPVLQGVMFIADNNGLTLKASNLESYVTIKLWNTMKYDVQIIEHGSVVITLPDVEKILMVKDLIRVKSDGNFVVSAQNAKKKSKIAGIDSKEFIDFPDIDMTNDSLVMVIPDGKEFCDTLKIVGVTKSDNTSKPIYTGFNFRSDYGTICTIDGFRMTVKNVNWFTDNTVDITVNGRIEKELAKIVGKSDRGINVYSGKMATGFRYAKFVGDDFEYIVRRLDNDKAAFADWKNFIPNQDVKAEFVFSDTKSVIETLKEYAKFNKNGISEPCVMTGYTDGNILTSYHSASYITTDEIAVDGNVTDEMFVGVNPDYLMGILNMYYKNDIDYSVKFYGKLSPIIITGGDYTCLVVPMRVATINRESIVADFVA